MRSPTESAAPRKAATRRVTDLAATFSRKTHYYLGLYFLFFVWLFAFTGLLLNHSWKFAEFWPSRKTSAFERQIEMPPPGTDLDRARDILRQLGIAGEIEWTASKAGSALREFRANRPGHNYTITVHADQNRAAVQHIELNKWGVMSVLHAFSGVRAGDARNQRDWILTEIWAFSMDAVAVGLIVMVLTGIYMWYRLRKKRMGGLLALFSGTIACAVLVAGLRWLYS